MTKEEIQNRIEQVAYDGATDGCNQSVIEREAKKLTTELVKLFAIPVVSNSKPITDEFGTLHLAFDDEEPCDNCKYTDEPATHDACVKCREKNPSQTYYC